MSVKGGVVCVGGEVAEEHCDFVLKSLPSHPTPTPHVANRFAVEMGFKEESLDTNKSMCVPRTALCQLTCKQL